MYNTIFTSGSNRNRVDKKTREQQNEKACNGYMPARSAGMFANIFSLLFLILSSLTAYADGTRTITWGSTTVSKTYTIACDTVYTISEGNATDIAGWMTFTTASSSCTIDVTLKSNTLRRNGDRTKYDKIYVSNGSTNIITTSPITPNGTWQYGTAINTSVTSSGNTVTVYFDNVYNSGRGTHNSQFTIEVKVSDPSCCCTNPEITFSPTSKTTTLGSSFTKPTMTYSGGGAQTWTSSDESVAIVNSSGDITIRNCGTTTITVSVDANGSYCAASQSYTLTVNGTAPALSNCPGTMDIGDELQLAWNTTATPTGWSSTNSTYLSVTSGGYLTANAAGTATVSATVAANGSYCAGTPYCDITVVEPPCTDPGTLSFSETTHTLTAGGSYTNTTLTNSTGQTATYSITPSGVSGVTFNTTTGEVSTIAGVEGVFTITATIPASGSYCSKSTSYTLTINDGCTRVGTHEPFVDYNNCSMAPIHGLYEHSWTQMIYTSSEIGGCCTINSISFNCASVSSAISRTIEIYMGMTDLTEFPDLYSFVNASDLTLVHTETWTPANGWKTFTLDTPYEYSNCSKNLIIAFKSDADNSINTYFYGGSVGSYSTIRASSDAGAININNASTTSSKERTQIRPDTKFCMTCCEKITPPLTFSFSESTGSVAAGGTTNVTLTNGTGQTVAWSSDNSGVATVSAATSGSSITATITGVAEGTAHITATVTGWTSGGTTYCDTTVTYTVTVSDGCTQIGSSTSSPSSYSPLYGADRYSYVQMLYTNAEVGSDACSITSIKFQYYTYGTSNPDRRVAIYIGHTSKASFDNDRDFVANSSLTPVYGTLGELKTWSITGGWNTLTLDTPFAYDGSSNIIVAVYYDYGSTPPYSAGTSFYYTATANRMVVMGYGDDNDPAATINNMGSYSGTFGSSFGSYRPNIKFCRNCELCNMEAEIEITD